MHTEDISDIVTTPFEAIGELRKRQQDPELKRKVEDFLQGDIPGYLKNGPVFCLARHIATPNFETLRFVHLMGDLGFNPVITEDSKSLFVSQNLVKRSLCKLPICKRITQKKGALHEHYQKENIVDFSHADGRLFSEIETVWGENIVDFHARLFGELGLKHKVSVFDDAEWIDRHHRGDLLEHYKHLLTLFVTHGVFFENYNTEDEHEKEFLEEILRPACDFVKERFGYRPLISPIFPTEPESYLFWISYPTKVLDIIKENERAMKRVVPKSPVVTLK